MFHTQQHCSTIQNISRNDTTSIIMHHLHCTTANRPQIHNHAVTPCISGNHWIFIFFCFLPFCKYSVAAKDQHNEKVYLSTTGLLVLTSSPRAVTVSWQNSYMSKMTYKLSKLRQTDLVFGLWSEFISTCRSVRAGLQVSTCSGCNMCRTQRQTAFDWSAQSYGNNYSWFLKYV